MIYYFIINPAAGSGKSKQAVPVIESVMRESGEEYRFIYTDRPNDTKAIRDAIEFNCAKAVICAGGDGTIQEILPLMIGSNIPVGVIPAGSGNDFIGSVPGFRMTSGSFEEKSRAYTKRLLLNNSMPIDVIEITSGTGDSKEGFHLLNIGSCGIDSEAVVSAHRIKRFFGNAAYLIALLKEIFTYSSKMMRISINGKIIEERLLLAAICNGAFYGGGFNIAPSACIDDGLITLCLVSHLSKLKVMALFPLVLFGKHTRLKEVLFENCTELTLEYEGEKLINIDGNLFTLKSPVRFSIIHNALRLLV